MDNNIPEHERVALVLLKSFERTNSLMSVLIGRAIDQIQEGRTADGIKALRRVQAVMQGVEPE